MRGKRLFLADPPQQVARSSPSNAGGASTLRKRDPQRVTFSLVEQVRPAAACSGLM